MKIWKILLASILSVSLLYIGTGVGLFYIADLLPAKEHNFLLIGSVSFTLGSAGLLCIYLVERSHNRATRQLQGQLKRAALRFQQSAKHSA